MRSSCIFLAAAAHLAATTSQAQSIFYTNLNPSVASSSYAAAVSETQQAGSTTIGDAYGACIWSGTPASFINLNPAGTTGSAINATTGTQQAGYAVIGVYQHAALWNGNASSFIDLNPMGATGSYACATTGTQQAGFAVLQGATVAGIWSGTAASFVNLNPTGASGSSIRAATNTQQAGQASIEGRAVAGIWSGTAASFVNLNPAGATNSTVLTTTGTRQGGIATIAGFEHAALWSGSVGSFIDLGGGAVYAMTNTQQVGVVSGGGGPGRAALWSGTVDSRIDLHAYLGNSYTYSSANAIWSDGSVTKIAGSARNSITGQDEAILWTITSSPTGTTSIISTILEGSGAFTLTAGTTTLSGTNTYQGGTTVNGGTLAITGSGTLGATTGSLVVNGGTLDLGSTSQAVGSVTLANGTITNGSLNGASFGSTGGRISAALSGTGAFTQTSGTTTLSGANTYQGGTIINGGILVLEGAGTLGNAAGPVIVNGGTLDIGVNNPAVRSNTITVNSGGRLMGSGSVFGHVFINGGQLSPGNSPGIVSATNYSQNGGVLDIEIGGATPGTGNGFHDQVQYTGTATITSDATLAITSWNGYTWSNGQAFRIIQDTDTSTLGFIGKFAHLTGAIGALSYDSTGATLTLYDSLAAVPGLADSRTAAFLGALSAAGGSASTTIQDKLAAGNVVGAKQDIKTASPLGLASLTAMPVSAAASNGDLLRSRENTARAADKSSDKWEAYVQSHGALTSAKTNADAPNFDHNLYGGKVGLEYGKSSTIGVVAGYDIGKASLLNGGGSADMNRASAMAYFSQTFAERGFAQVGLGAGVSSYESKRKTFAGTAKGDTNGTDFDMAVSIGYNAQLGGNFEVTPYAALTYTHAIVSGFTETGSALALMVADYSQDSLRAKVGGDFGWNASKQVRIGLDLALAQELMDHEVEIPATFASGGSSFKTKAFATPVTILSAGPNLLYAINESTAVSIGYKYEMGFDANTSHRFDAAFNYRF